MNHSHKNHSISPLQLKALERCLIDIEAHSVCLYDSEKSIKSLWFNHAPYETIYMFYRTYRNPIRVYVGQSPFGRNRITDQIKNLKWATHVMSLEFGAYLEPQTLLLIENSVLGRGLATFPGVLWHNERGLGASLSDGLVRRASHPMIDALAVEILEIFGRRMPYEAFTPLPQYQITHIIGDPMGEYFGKLSHRGRCVFLLKGSRISSRAKNITALRRIGGVGLKYGEGFYCRGELEHKPRTLSRPEGLVITEPVRFKNKEEAARFLTLDDPTSAWKRV